MILRKSVITHFHEVKTGALHHISKKLETILQRNHTSHDNWQHTDISANEYSVVIIASLHKYLVFIIYLWSFIPMTKAKSRADNEYCCCIKQGNSLAKHQVCLCHVMSSSVPYTPIWHHIYAIIWHDGLYFYLMSVKRNNCNWDLQLKMNVGQGSKVGAPLVPSLCAIHPTFSNSVLPHLSLNLTLILI